MREFFDFIVYECNVCRVYSDITSYTAHGDSNICFFEGGCIVDAVADHTDFFLLLLIFTDPVQFIFWQAARMDFSDMKLTCDRRSCIFVIACKKYRFYSKFCQLVNHFRTLTSHSICKCKITCQALIDGDINHRTSLIQKFFSLFFHICREIDPIFTKHIYISRQNCVCIHFAGNTTSRDHLKLSCG